MLSTCLLDDKPDNVRRRNRRAEIQQHQDIMLQRSIDANRKLYPSLYKIIDSQTFQNWWVICTGRAWDARIEADPKGMALKLNAMQLIYGDIP